MFVAKFQHQRYCAKSKGSCAKKHVSKIHITSSKNRNILQGLVPEAQVKTTSNQNTKQNYAKLALVKSLVIKLR